MHLRLQITETSSFCSARWKTWGREVPGCGKRGVLVENAGFWKTRGPVENVGSGGKRGVWWRTRGLVENANPVTVKNKILTRGLCCEIKGENSKRKSPSTEIFFLGLVFVHSMHNTLFKSYPCWHCLHIHLSFSKVKNTRFL